MSHCYCMILLALWLTRQACSAPVGKEVTCDSLLPGGSCEPSSDACTPDAKSSCYTVDTIRKRDNIDEVTVRECMPSGLYYGIFLPCATSDSKEDPPDILTRATAQIVSTDPDHYSVNVSWTVSNISGNYSGYMVELYENTIGSKYTFVKRCVCVQNLTITKFDFLELDYHHVNKITYVEVTPYPVPTGVVADQFTVRTEEKDKPQGCADAFANDSVCSVRHYMAATNVSVQSRVSSAMKELRVSWEHPSVATGSQPPPSYYLYIYQDRSRVRIFKVYNATSVVVRNLNASLNYTARLQAYGRCSGLGDLHRELTPSDLGCGEETDEVFEEPEVKHFTTASPTSGATTDFENETANTSVQGQLPAANTDNSNKIQLWSTVVSTSVIVKISLVIIIIIVVVRKYKSPKKDLERCSPNVKNAEYKYKILVFYCPSLPEREKIFVQKYVVQLLSDYFQVETVDDIIRGNISDKLQAAVQEARSVLLVANEHFRSQWSQEDGDTAVNCLRLIISAAAARGNLGKFGVVYTEGTSHDATAHMPDNEYLHYLPRFEMSKTVQEVENIKCFVTHTKKVAFSRSEPDTTPTTEGPPHLAAQFSPLTAVCYTGTDTPSPTNEELSLATCIVATQAEAFA